MYMFDDFFMSIMSALGINANLGAVLFFLCLGASASVVQMARQGVRLKMHADHFDVLDKTHTESLKQSSKALEQSSYTKGSVDTLFLLLGDDFKALIKGSALMEEINGNSSESSEPASDSSLHDRKLSA